MGTTWNLSLWKTSAGPPVMTYADETLSLDTKDSTIERFCAVLPPPRSDEIDAILRKFYGCALSQGNDSVAARP